jgi:aldose 1-epimerase
MPLTGKQFTIKAGQHEVTVVEVGGGLRRYTHGGVDVLAPYGEQELPPNGAGQVLMPWPNRLRGGRYSFGGRIYQLPITEVPRGNANHGLARWARWAPVAIDRAAVTLACDIVPQTGWPFEIRAELTYALHSDHGLAITAVARNHGRTPAPFGAGFHPYFSTHGHSLDEVTVHVPADQRLVTDEAQLPVGVQEVAKTHYDLRKGSLLKALRLDDTFTNLSTVDGQATVGVRTRSGGAHVWFDAAFGFLQVYTHERLGGEGAPAVAVEPMTCPADAFNSGAGLIVLEPGQVWTGKWGIAPLAQ